MTDAEHSLREKAGRATPDWADNAAKKIMQPQFVEANDAGEPIHEMLAATALRAAYERGAADMMKKVTKICHKSQMDNVFRRDRQDEKNEEWQVYNHAVFVVGQVETSVRALATQTKEKA